MTGAARLLLQAGVAGRMGARSIQLASESPLSFQLGMPAAPRGGISDAMDAAIHTNLPAHPYTGAQPSQQLYSVHVSR